MGPSVAVNVIFRKQIEALPEEDRAAAHDDIVKVIREQIAPYVAAGRSFIDERIDPAETRSIVCPALEMFEDKRVEGPWHKLGVLPV